MTKIMSENTSEMQPSGEAAINWLTTIVHDEAVAVDREQDDKKDELIRVMATTDRVPADLVDELARMLNEVDDRASLFQEALTGPHRFENAEGLVLALIEQAQARRILYPVIPELAARWLIRNVDELRPSAQEALKAHELLDMAREFVQKARARQQPTGGLAIVEAFDGEVARTIERYLATQSARSEAAAKKVRCALAAQRHLAEIRRAAPA